MKTKMLLSVFMLAMLLSPFAFAQPTGPDHGALTRFENALAQDGFDVTAGTAGILNLASEWCAGTAGVEHAMFTNNAPYLRFQIPKSAQDPQPVDSFKLRPEEAIVLIGPTPPPVKYFGYHPFLATRIYPDGSRQQLFAALGDAVNNATINTIGPSPYSTLAALIFTPDRGTDARVRAALRRAGYPTAIINTVVFPLARLNLGDGENADELKIVLRIGMPESASAINTYLQQASAAITVLRVTPHPQVDTDPFPVPQLRVRGTGVTEMDLANTLEQLRQGIIDANPGLVTTDIQTMPNWFEGSDYIQRWHDPWADSRDAFFLTAGNVQPFGSTGEVTLADDEFLMVYGPNHVATGKATYMSVNAYASETAKMSIGQVFYDVLAGTAAPYLFPGDPAAEMMYAYKVSRNCGSEPYCMQLGVEGCPRLTIDSSTILGFIIRMYLEPATRVGPAMPEILYDRVIKFSPPSE